MSETTYYSTPCPDDKPGNEHRKELHCNYTGDIKQRVTETRKITLKGGDGFKFKNGTVTLKAHGTPLNFSASELRMLWALDILQQNGLETTTMRELYEAMGYSHNYSKNWRSLSGPMKSWLQGLSNTEVEFNIDGATTTSWLLPVTYKTVTNDKGEVEFIIKFSDQQPIAKYLRETGQYYPVDFDIFATPFNKTDEYMALENYCINYVMTSESDDGALTVTGINGPAGTHFNNKKMLNNVRILFDFFKKIEFIKEYSIKFDTKTAKDMLYFKK